MHSSKQSERFDSIDLIETLGILLVLFYHCWYINDNIVDSKDVMCYVNYYIKSSFSMCVPLFFFANGYLLFSRKVNMNRHIYKIIKLIFLAVTWGVITLAILMPINGEYLSLVDIMKAIVNWKMGWINHLWYFGALVIIYLFFPIIKAAYDNEKKHFYFFLTCCFILTFGNIFANMGANIVYFILKRENNEISYNFFNMFNAFRGIYGYAFVYFCIGGVIYEFKDKILEKRKLPTAILVIVLSCGFLTLYGIFMSLTSGNMWDVVWNGYDTVFTLMNVLAIYVIAISYKRKGKFGYLVQLISKNTLGIYLVHNIVNLYFKPMISNINICNNLIFNFLYVLFILACSLLITAFFKKIPIIKKLFVL